MSASSYKTPQEIRGQLIRELTDMREKAERKYVGYKDVTKPENYDYKKVPKLMQKRHIIFAIKSIEQDNSKKDINTYTMFVNCYATMRTRGKDEDPGIIPYSNLRMVGEGYAHPYFESINEKFKAALSSIATYYKNCLESSNMLERSFGNLSQLTKYMRLETLYQEKNQQDFYYPSIDQEKKMAAAKIFTDTIDLIEKSSNKSTEKLALFMYALNTFKTEITKITIEKDSKLKGTGKWGRMIEEIEKCTTKIEASLSQVEQVDFKSALGQAETNFLKIVKSESTPSVSLPRKMPTAINRKAKNLSSSSTSSSSSASSSSSIISTLNNERSSVSADPGLESLQNEFNASVNNADDRQISISSPSSDTNIQLSPNAVPELNNSNQNPSVSIIKAGL